VLFLDEALSGVEEQLEKNIVSRLIADPSIEILIYAGHRMAVSKLFERQVSLN